jgi:uncharacterized membrane protein
MKRLLLLTIIILTLITSVSATILQGNVYGSSLELEQNVLIEINTEPAQKYLAKDGHYQFNLPLGNYQLTATKGFFKTSEEIQVSTDGDFVYDLFLIEDFSEEDDLWKDTEEPLFTAIEEEERSYEWWRYTIAGLIILYLAIRLLKFRKKYGRLKIFRKKVRAEHKKTIEEHKQELETEPGYLEKTLEIIKKHEGRISQKQLRGEMLNLSEAKISLILTELEHKGKIEKIKKGRGNVILLK